MSAVGKDELVGRWEVGETEVGKEGCAQTVVAEHGVRMIRYMVFAEVWKGGHPTLIALKRCVSGRFVRT